MHKELRISITPGTVVMALFVLAGAYLVWYLRDLVLLIITAVVLASAIRPGVLFFVGLHFPRIVAVLTMYTLLFGGAFLLIYFFFPPIISETANFFTALPEYLDRIAVPFTDERTSALISTSESTLSSLLAFRDAFTDTSEGMLRLVTTFFGGIFAFMLVTVLSFYFAIQEQGIEDFLRLVTPLKYEEYVISLWHRAQHKIGLWMQGQIVLSALAGVLVYLGLLIVEAPYALLLGVLTAIAEVIPIFGSLFAGAVAVAVVWSTSGFALAFIVAGLFVLVNQFEANLIYPLVVKKIVGVPPLLVIVGIIAGAELAGFLGAFLSVPIAAILQEFVSDIDRGRRMRAAAPTASVE